MESIRKRQSKIIQQQVENIVSEIHHYCSFQNKTSKNSNFVVYLDDYKKEFNMTPEIYRLVKDHPLFKEMGVMIKDSREKNTTSNKSDEAKVRSRIENFFSDEDFDEYIKIIRKNRKVSDKIGYIYGSDLIASVDESFEKEAVQEVNNADVRYLDTYVVDDILRKAEKIRASLSPQVDVKDYLWKLAENFSKKDLTIICQYDNVLKTGLREMFPNEQSSYCIIEYPDEGIQGKFYKDRLGIFHYKGLESSSISSTVPRRKKRTSEKYNEYLEKLENTPKIYTWRMPDPRKKPE